MKTFTKSSFFNKKLIRLRLAPDILFWEAGTVWLFFVRFGVVSFVCFSFVFFCYFFVGCVCFVFVVHLQFFVLFCLVWLLFLFYIYFCFNFFALLFVVLLLCFSTKNCDRHGRHIDRAEGGVNSGGVY